MIRRFAGAATAIVVGVAASAASPVSAAEDPWARPWSPGDARRAVLKTLDDEGPVAAAALVLRLAEPGVPRVRGRDVEAAKAAFDLLPRTEGAPVAAALIALSLRADASDAGGAWTFAQTIRKDAIRRADVTVGVPFLRDLLAIYPDVHTYRYDLGVLYLDSAQRAEARAEFEKAFRSAPSTSVESGYRLAEMLEQDGDARGAVAIYDEILGTRPTEFPAHGARASVLALTLGDVTAALAALDEAAALAASAPEGPERTRALADLDERRRLILKRETNRAAIREVDRRTSILAWTALLAALAGIGVLFRWVSRLRPADPAGDATPGDRPA